MKVFEEKLGQAMAKLAIVENARARKTWGNMNAYSAEKNQKNAYKGGRPKSEKPLNFTARMVDKMLKNGLNCVEIADVLDKHPDTVRDIKARYELPREERL
mgnify:FL=1|tara:strand:+ start:222 stop:524 length:303 start_codon:yes stop_codon:yes gene_type:complete